MPFVRLKVDTVKSLRSSVLEAILDNDRRGNCWGVEFHRRIKLKDFAPMPVLLMAAVTASLMFQRELGA